MEEIGYEVEDDGCGSTLTSVSLMGSVLEVWDVEQRNKKGGNC